MNIGSLPEFPAHAARLLRSDDPVLMGRRGRFAGVLFPRPHATLPLALKRRLFELLSGEIGRQLAAAGISEDSVVASFRAWRSGRRKAGRRFGADVLISALVGGRAQPALTHPDVGELLTTGATLGEVHEFAAYLGRRKHVELDLLALAVALLPVTVVEGRRDAAALREARRRIGRRDPNDVELLALAVENNADAWSNDKDFDQADIQRHTTDELRRHLGLP